MFIYKKIFFSMAFTLSIINYAHSARFVCQNKTAEDVEACTSAGNTWNQDTCACVYSTICMDPDGCLGEREPIDICTPTETQLSECEADGGSWNYLICECRACVATPMQKRQCLNRGGTLNEHCECIVPEDPAEPDEQDLPEEPAEPDEPDLCEPLPNCSDIGFKYTASECGTLEKMKCPFDDRSYFCSANNSCPDGLFGSVEEAVAGCSDKYIWTAVAGNGVTMTKCYECCSGQMTAPGNSYNYDTKTGIDGKVCYYNIEAKPYVCDSICQCQNQCDAQYDDSCNRFGGSACEALAYCISQCK